MLRNALLLLGVLGLCGCAGLMSLDSRSGVSASVVDFLYPHGGMPNVDNKHLPTIDLPARVGLAFVPATQAPQGLTSADQEQLLAQVRLAFAGQGFIDRIEIIPENYLRPGGGFDNLDQVARLYGVDIIALVSWDQLIQSNESVRSLLYWTLVGAYTIKGSSNQVITFVDTAVLHVPSQSLLFRAPGQHRQSRRSTAIRAGEIQTNLARQGFVEAMSEMTINLDQALENFNQRVRDEGQVRLVDRQSGQDWHTTNGGQGRIDLLTIVLLLGLVVFSQVPILKGSDGNPGQ